MNFLIASGGILAKIPLIFTESQSLSLIHIQSENNVFSGRKIFFLAQDLFSCSKKILVASKKNIAARKKKSFISISRKKKNSIRYHYCMGV